jgi:cystathionine gamma-lyase
MIFLRIIILVLLFNNLSLSNSKKIPKDKFFNKKGYGTKFVHAGSEIDLNTGSIVPSITLSTTFVQKLPGEKLGINCENSYGNGYFYSRQANPTRGALERALAVSENAKYAGVFSSGMSAISTVIQLLNSGDHVITLDNLYGGTSKYFKEIRENLIHKVDISIERSLYLIRKVYIQEVPNLIRMK